MKFSQAFLLLALGLFVSLPQEVKGSAGLLFGGPPQEHQSTGAVFLGGGFLGGGGQGGQGWGSSSGSQGGGWGSSSGSQGGGWSSSGGFLGGGSVNGGWSSSGGSGGSIQVGGSGSGGGGGGQATGGGQAGGGGQQGNYLGVFNPLPGSEGSPNIMYPYGPSEGDAETPHIDDGAVEVPISIPFPFFSQTYHSLFVNNNGVVSCGVPVSKYTPDPFPLADGSPFVAPYWGDVNNAISGNVYFRQTTDPKILQRVSNDINRYFPNSNYRPKWAFIATWCKVPYFGSKSDLVNTFQAVLTTNGKQSYIVLNYDKIQWTTGTASGGNAYTGQGGKEAQAGFNSGDDTHYFNIPNSRTPDVIYIARTSNVDVPGVWAFRTDNFAVPGGCVAGVNFAKFGDTFWMDDACEQKCTCQTDGETACTPNACSISEVCKSNKWYFVCDAPDSCI